MADCKHCSEPLELNEDYLSELHRQVDCLGMESLTEDEQAMLEGYIAECPHCGTEV